MEERPASPFRDDLGSLVQAADSGDPAARAVLFQKLYQDLHRLAESQLRRADPAMGVSATSLLHELYIAMSDGRPASFPDKDRFLCYAARAMRGLVIDSIRARRAEKRGGQFHITAMTTAAAEALTSTSDVTALTEALDFLEETEPPLAELVNLSFFGGLTFAEIAALRGVAERTVQRDWRKARLFLKSTLRES